MPKNKLPVKGKNNKNIQRKFKIGTRKGGRSAHRMTNRQLVDALGNKGLRKHHHKIAQVLILRNVDFAKLLGPAA